MHHILTIALDLARNCFMCSAYHVFITKGLQLNDDDHEDGEGGDDKKIVSMMIMTNMMMMMMMLTMMTKMRTMVKTMMI